MVGGDGLVLNRHFLSGACHDRSTWQNLFFRNIPCALGPVETLTPRQFVESFPELYNQVFQNEFDWEFERVIRGSLPTPNRPPILARLNSILRNRTPAQRTLFIRSNRGKSLSQNIAPVKIVLTAKFTGGPSDYLDMYEVTE